MKILFITSRFPYPLEKGDKLRGFHFIKNLSNYHDIVLVSLTEEKVTEESKKILNEFVSEIHIIPFTRFQSIINIILAFLKGLPLQVGYFYNMKANKKIRNVIEASKPDHIFCQLHRTALYVKDISIPKTIDYQDVFSHGIKLRISKSKGLWSSILKFEYKRMQKFENLIFDWFDKRIIISEPDRNYIPHKDKDKIHIIPNGVDFEYYNPDFPENNTNKEFDILFSGNMGYPPNVSCAKFIVKKIMPILKKTYPNICIGFVGASPHPSLLKYKSKNITITGWVDDIRPYYASSKVFLAPLQIGTGLQNKLLEAMAMKLPCVTSPLANNALKAKHGKEILIGKDASEISNHVLFLLNNADEASRIAQNGCLFVNENYNWATQVKKLNDILEFRI